MADKEMETMVQTIIKARILEAFNEGPKLIEQLIEASFKHKVDPHSGQPSTYSRQNDIPYLDFIVGEQIRMAARQAVIEAIQHRKEQIKHLVEAKLDSEDFSDRIVEAMVGAMSEDWRVNVKFEGEAKRERY